MWPWGHLAIAYLVYTLYSRVRYGRSPRALPAIAVAIGSQFPDLIDKPLAWELGLLSSGRSLAHSITVASLLIPVVYAVGVRVGHRESAAAFAIGHVTHLVTDLPPMPFRGDFDGATYLFWPFLGPPEYGESGGVLVLFSRHSFSIRNTVQLAVFAIAIVVWYRDRVPGLGFAWRSVRRYVPLGE
ncbi:metal-dependent hydrolase [Natrinema salaciae]|uniref:LexA-binding, inner membrane-associated putative hydrolase n=1 Tax=Natrinema salaciae TaxID=1186196 RepID=A0A1H8ZPF6_9EURY|nr:metal-dependent hydrolase [Natrinema salaciae]SEP65548.1 LexA-binding, inner membrane-associated putative hydrolase [Natrinema salaciae]